MKLSDLGYNEYPENLKIGQNTEGFDTGRIIAEHRERYIVRTDKGEFVAEITGNMRFTATNREGFPAVGDWVSLTTYDHDFAIIHRIYPRKSLIKRQAAGQSGVSQIIASNIDYAFLVQAIDRDFNVNRLERYLTLCNESNIKPVIVLTKTDLISGQRLREITDIISGRIKEVPVIAVSNETHAGFEILLANIIKGKTYCLLGSSGAGKSTLLNNIAGKEIMRTGEISSAVGKGKHITSHRELFILENGAILIDNPGMREVGIADAGEGLEITFNRIISLAHDCRFKDCTHTGESGCAVMKAVENQELDRASYENYLKLEREKAHYESSLAEKRKKDRQFGKMFKNYMKQAKKNRL